MLDNQDAKQLVITFNRLCESMNESKDIVKQIKFNAKLAAFATFISFIMVAVASTIALIEFVMIMNRY